MRRSFPSGATVRIYYAANESEEGLTDVKLTLRRFNGDLLIVDEQPMAELGNGLYFYDHTCTVDDWYVARCHSESRKGLGFAFFRAGTPVGVPYELVGWRAHLDETGLSEPFKVTDGLGAVFLIGVLTEMGHGIYYADVGSLATGRYFFHVKIWDAPFNHPMGSGGGNPYPPAPTGVTFDLAPPAPKIAAIHE